MPRPRAARRDPSITIGRQRPPDVVAAGLAPPGIPPNILKIARRAVFRAPPRYQPSGQRQSAATPIGDERRGSPGRRPYGQCRVDKADGHPHRAKPRFVQLENDIT